MSQAPKPAPVTLAIDLKCSVEHAFDAYTTHIGNWWPLESHAVETDKTDTCVFEAEDGGRIFEITSEGNHHLWGTVLKCQRPALLLYSWHPGRKPDEATRVEIRFEAQTGGCRLTLKHEGFEILGEPGVAVREGYQTGWQYVLGERFRSYAET